jgi:UDP-N-acetylglucosamine 2-epimerase
LKVVSVVGARPEFIQAAPVSEALRSGCQEILVHTGQHYDESMSDAFFRDLQLPDPEYNLAIGSSSHARQTAEILIGLEAVLVKENPQVVLVRGDTNSTLGAALAAVKLGIPVAHIEAGERSFDRSMPEEINRLVVDRISEVHFCVGQRAVQNLAAEGICAQVYPTGDVMLDAFTHYLPIAHRHSTLVRDLGLPSGRYVLLTVHRSANADDPDRLARIVAAINRSPYPVVFPVHPRTRKALLKAGLVFSANVSLIDPVGYLDMLVLEENARLIVTDSGGVQREAYFLSVPCVTLRANTEWIETVETGWNGLVQVKEDDIVAALAGFVPPTGHPPIFGDSQAARKIAEILMENYGNR